MDENDTFLALKELSFEEAYLIYQRLANRYNERRFNGAAHGVDNLIRLTDRVLRQHNWSYQKLADYINGKK